MGAHAMPIWLCTLVGLALTAAMIVITEYYTATEYSPVQHVAAASQTGHATNIIAGLGVSMKACALPVIAVCLEHLGLLSARGPLRHRHRRHRDAVDDRHDRRARCLRPDHRQRRRHRRDGRPATRRCATSPIRWMRSATPPRRSPRATPSARPGSRRWCCSPTTRTSSRRSLGHATAFDLSNPAVIIGLFIGGLIPYLFAAMAMEAVGRAAGSVVNEVRRQFREIKGIMEGTAKPDYSRAVDMLTRPRSRR